MKYLSQVKLQPYNMRLRGHERELPTKSTSSIGKKLLNRLLYRILFFYYCMIFWLVFMLFLCFISFHLYCYLIVSCQLITIKRYLSNNIWYIYAKWYRQLILRYYLQSVHSHWCTYNMKWFIIMLLHRMRERLEIVEPKAGYPTTFN